MHISDKLSLPQSLYDTMVQVKQLLDSKGIPNTIIGGIAVGSHSNPRTTSDIDFAIKSQDENKVRSLFKKTQDLAVEYRHGFTANVNDHDIDFIVLDDHEPFVVDNKIKHKLVDTFDVVSAYDLIYLKLTSGLRSKDASDIIAIIKALDDKASGFLPYIFGKISKKLYKQIKEEFEYLKVIADLEEKKDKRASLKFRLFMLRKLS